MRSNISFCYCTSFQSVKGRVFSQAKIFLLFLDSPYIFITQLSVTQLILKGVKLTQVTTQLLYRKEVLIRF